MVEEGVSNRNSLTAKLYRPKPIISVDCSLKICLWKVAGILKFALRPESIELSHSFGLARCKKRKKKLPDFSFQNVGVTEVTPNRDVQWSARQVHTAF